MVNVIKTHHKEINNQRYHLSFYYGAKIGILYLNGAGKSTVMKIIAGIDKNFQGDVVFSQELGYFSELNLMKQTVKKLSRKYRKLDLLIEYSEINNKFMDEEIMNDADKMNELIDKQGSTRR